MGQILMRKTNFVLQKHDSKQYNQESCDLYSQALMVSHNSWIGGKLSIISMLSQGNMEFDCILQCYGAK